MTTGTEVAGVGALFAVIGGNVILIWMFALAFVLIRNRPRPNHPEYTHDARRNIL